MRMRGTMNGSVLWALFYVFLHVGSAEDGSCAVTVRGKHTVYNITKMPNVSHLESCEYSWANASNHVLAHKWAEHPELVVTKSVDALVVSQCMNHTILSLDCFSQGLKFIIHCFCDCSESASLQEDKGPLMKTSNPWINVIIVIALILVLILICFLVYRYRDDISRICKRLCNYTPEKRSSVDEPMFNA